MPFFYAGAMQATIGIDEFMIKCPACETHQFADFMIVSNYYHVYFIPIFPFSKEAHIVCQKCGLRRSGLPFERRLLANFDEVKGKFKHPLYTYCFSFVVGVLILLAMLT